MITFGAHKGKKISEIPESYLKWGSENLKGEWQQKFKDELIVRSGKRQMNKHSDLLEKLNNSCDIIPYDSKDASKEAITYGKPGQLKLDAYNKFKTTNKSVGQELIEAMKEAVAYEKGEIALKTTVADSEVDPSKWERTVAKRQPSKYDPLIFGKDQTEEIVNITVKDDKVYTYLLGGEERVEDYQCWILNAERKGTKLKGNQYYSHIKHVDQETYNRVSAEWNNTRWCPRSKEEGYMLLNGVTYFKGMRVQDVSILSVDIETTGLDSNAEDAEVILISNTFRKKGKYHRRFFSIKDYLNDEDMIASWCEYVNSLNPDIVIGHNIIGFDINYLASQRNLNIGRDSSDLTFADKLAKFRKDGQQSYEYLNPRIHGREIIDSMFLCIKYDVNHQFPSYGLKAVEKHLGIAPEDRIEWDFKKYPTREYKNWPDSVYKKFIKYCSQDSDSPIKMFDIMIPSFFYMNQSIPKTLQQMINEATGSQLDAIMVRSYLQDGYSQPRTSQKNEFEGAISMGQTGIFNYVRKVDVAALYPSIMLEYEICDKRKDPNKNMIKILSYFREQRLENKKKFKNTNDKYYDDLQGSQKILINSLYGFLGAGYLLYNYPDGASQITKHGREILQTAVRWATGCELKKVVKKVVNGGKDNEESKYHWIVGPKVHEGKGYTLVNCDTDSIAYTNGKKPTQEEFKAEIEEINTLYPKNIHFEDDGVFEKLIVAGAKNYVKKKDGEVKYTGSAFSDSKKEPKLRELLFKMTQIMLEDNDQLRLLNCYKQYVKDAYNITNIYDWCTKKTVTAKMETGDRANEIKPMNAVKEAIEKGVIKGYQQGDKIHMYQAIDGLTEKIVKGKVVVEKKTGQSKMIPNEINRVPELWGNDHDRMHYVSRVFKTVKILNSILNMEHFIDYSLTKNKTALEKLVSGS